MWDPTLDYPVAFDIEDISIHGSRVGPDTETEDVEEAENISIHGSRVGPDIKGIDEERDEIVFQSTGPVWDPTGSSL